MRWKAPQYISGQETFEATAERAQRLSKLRELEAPSFALGIAGGVHRSGREPAALPL